MLLLGPIENVDTIFDKHVYQNDNVRQVSGGGVLLIVHCFLLSPGPDGPPGAHAPCVRRPQEKRDLGIVQDRVYTNSIQ